MAHGAFGAMGGIQTSAADYARWVAFLLAAWPARNDADIGPVKRATVRELAQGSNFARLVSAPADGPGKEPCKRAVAYGMGMTAATDCELGTTLSHGGGYPGYGSFVLLLPEQGIGVFEFGNRTYSGSSKSVYQAASMLKKAGFFKDRPVAISSALAAAYLSAGAIYRQGEVTTSSAQLAMNFLLDRDAAGRALDLAALKERVGECDTAATVVATGALSGTFTWRCLRGSLDGRILLAPTQPPRIQALEFRPGGQGS